MIPTRLPVSRPVYPFAFYFVLFTLPFLIALSEARPTSTQWIISSTVSVGLIASFVLIQWRCTSWALSYWYALGAKCFSLESGCVNITLIYIIPLLLVYHLRFFVTALLSFFLGRSYAQVATLEFIASLLAPDYPIEKVKKLLYAGE